MEYIPDRTYRRASETLLGKEAWRVAKDFPRLNSLVICDDVPIEEWIDLADPTVAGPPRQAYAAIEKQLPANPPPSPAS